VCTGADDDGQHAALRGVQRAAVEHPLTVAAARYVLQQRLHQPRQALLGGGVLQVDGGDGLVAEALDHAQRPLQLGRVQAEDALHLRGGRRVDDGVHRLGAVLAAVAHGQRPAPRRAARQVDAAVPQDTGAACREIAFHGMRQQRTEVGARQPHVRCGGARAQAVAQHGGQHLRGGLVQRRVQRGQRQRTPDAFDQTRRLPLLRQPVLRGLVGRDGPVLAPQPWQQGRQRRAIAPREAARTRDGRRQMPGCRQPRCGHVKAIGILDAERHAQHDVVQRDAQFGQQRRGRGVRADQQVLAVVQDVSLSGQIQFNAPRASAQFCGGFDQQHLPSGTRQFMRRRAAGPAATDDRDPL